MSEVKRYVFQHVVRDGTSRSFTKKVQQFTLADDFDRVTAERDALQQRLTAADDRADRNATLAVSLAADKHALGNRVNVLEGLLRETSAILRTGDGYGWEDRAADRIDAALKPTEGVGDD